MPSSKILFSISKAFILRHLYFKLSVSPIPATFFYSWQKLRHAQMKLTAQFTEINSAWYYYLSPPLHSSSFHTQRVLWIWSCHFRISTCFCRSVHTVSNLGNCGWPIPPSIIAKCCFIKTFTICCQITVWMHSPNVCLPTIPRNNHIATLNQSAKNNRRPTTTICLLKIITHTCRRSSRHFSSAHIVILFHFSITKTFFHIMQKSRPSGFSQGVCL